ncbi:MAG: stress response translation initiation inhibitor YciH [Ktedonobacteraceae bacterium]
MSDNVVYSTDGGRIRPSQPSGEPTKKSDGIVRIMRDRKQRGGKTVTVITGVSAGEEALTALAQQLKKLCGSGGTVKDGTIEIQGDHCDKIQAKLIEMGYKVKRAGG